ncbi:N-formylglutamate amidohydrolase [Motiliproteus sp.]|uniref:N-formylglutamate amidohydrolase n=1 Tax=Motiliproteus sp. TaxID=1898955 RepID=UPI003BAC3B6A
MTQPRSETTPLLTLNDPPPYSLLNPSSDTPLLLICDHASNFVPARLQHLGLSAAQMEEHIAWDRGAADVVQLMSDRLGCRAMLANYSRLLIDVNRDPNQDEPDLIPEMSDGQLIPDNQHLSPEQRRERKLRISQPYHQEIERQLDALTAYTPAPMLFSIHTFTPAMQACGKPRPWHAGMLWNRDPRIAKPLMAFLRRHEHLLIGDNEPYSGREFAYSINRHGHERGFPNCAIEIRQDLLQSHEDCLWWAEALADGLSEVLEQPSLHRVQFFD